MPKVNGKKYPYTAAGKAAAKKATKKSPKMKIKSKGY
tara:strand:+ start:41 stop:151 length:111 start_codon:yes stop_codon:yes gene_type:complete